MPADLHAQPGRAVREAQAVITGRLRAASWPISPPACWWPIWATIRRVGGSGCSGTWAWTSLEDGGELLHAVPLTAYNAMTEIEMQAPSGWSPCCKASPAAPAASRCCGRPAAARRFRRPSGRRSTAGPGEDIILATRRLSRQEGPGRRGHRQRDGQGARPRVRFISFPTEECINVRAAASRSTWRRTRRAGRLGGRARQPDLLPDHRAVSGRRRLVSSAEGISAAAGAVLPRARHRLHPRRGAGEFRPHRPLFAFTITASSRISWCWARDWATACR